MRLALCLDRNVSALRRFGLLGTLSRRCRSSSRRLVVVEQLARPCRDVRVARQQSSAGVRLPDVWRSRRTSPAASAAAPRAAGTAIRESTPEAASGIPVARPAAVPKTAALPPGVRFSHPENAIARQTAAAINGNGRIFISAKRLPNCLAH